MTPLRFFRKYNKWILVVGVSILMIAFLVGPTLQMIAPKPEKRSIGTIDGETITLRDHRSAQAELGILSAVHWTLAFFATDDQLRSDGNSSATNADNALKWLLMRSGAAAMGLTASNDEVGQLLRLLEVEDDQIARIASSSGVPSETVREVLRDWITVQDYKELLYGRGHIRMEDRLAKYQQAARFLQFGFLPGYRVIADGAHGSHRISRPLLERFLHDQSAKVKITAMRIGADRFISEVTSPDMGRLEELFEKYGDMLPGEGAPYGFGYRAPDQVKLEYLAFPISRLRDVVHIEEADLVTYYDEHLDEFQVTPNEPDDQTDPGPATSLSQTEPITKPYEQVRPEIIDRIKDQRARRLGQKMAHAALALFEQHDRSLVEAGGYKVLTDEFTMLPLSAVAESLLEQFEVLPDVVHRDDRWLDRLDLANLPGIGASRVHNNEPVTATEYVFSAKEFESQQQDQLAALPLQVKIAGAPLTGADGSLYIVRLLDVQPARTPESLDAVRARVEADARKLAAFKQLLVEAANWKQRMHSEPMDDVAEQLGTTLIEPSSFPKREAGIQGVPEIPNIQGIGRHRILVDRVFALVTKLGGSDVESAPLDQRVDVIEAPEKLSIYLVRLDDYTPISRSEYEEVAKSPFVLDQLAQSLRSEQESGDPLSIEVLYQRVGFEPVRQDFSEKDEEDDADEATDET